MSFRVGDDVRVDFAGEVVQADPLIIRAAEGGAVWTIPADAVKRIPENTRIERQSS